MEYGDDKQWLIRIIIVFQIIEVQPSDNYQLDPNDQINKR